jgi:hypothetical protein
LKGIEMKNWKIAAIAALVLALGMSAAAAGASRLNAPTAPPAATPKPVNVGADAPKNASGGAGVEQQGQHEDADDMDANDQDDKQDMNDQEGDDVEQNDGEQNDGEQNDGQQGAEQEGEFEGEN